MKVPSNIGASNDQTSVISSYKIEVINYITQTKMPIRDTIPLQSCQID